MKMHKMLSIIAIMVVTANSLVLGQTNTFPANGYVGIGTNTPTKPLTINAGTNDAIYLISKNSHDWYLGPNVGPGIGFGIYDATINKMRLRIDEAGNVVVGIGTSRPTKPFTINAGKNDAISMTSENSHDWYLGPNVGPGAGFGIYDATTSAIRLKIDADGNVGIGTNTPTKPLTINAGAKDAIYMISDNSHNWYLGPNVGSGIGFGIYDATINKMRLRIDEVGNVSVGVLEITGGGDLAEPFEVEATESIKPGMVVAIDPDKPGQLRIADKAYDHTVAGIISGANGVNPGLTMKKEGTIADGSFPVSLTGRVYCWADASYGAITPGDLLTTSNTRGHAMKVTDYAKAQGAIIGKAMSSLTEGKGFVLVLITLQ